jgi:hypothetical protein
LEVEFGRCPLCGRAMSDRVKHVTLRDKILEFPYYLHWCPYHGYFIWRGRKGYELADFSKIEREAISVKPKPPDVKAPYTDYSIVRMKCPYCGFKWKQYKDTPPNSWGNIIVCPSCKSEISKEKAMLK